MQNRVKAIQKFEEDILKLEKYEIDFSKKRSNR